MIGPSNEFIAVAERSYRHITENQDLRSWVQTPGHASNFSTSDCKKHQQGYLESGE